MKRALKLPLTTPNYGSKKVSGVTDLFIFMLRSHNGGGCTGSAETSSGTAATFLN